MKRCIYTHKIKSNIPLWKEKLIHYIASFPYATVLNTNNYTHDQYRKYDFIAAFSSHQATKKNAPHPFSDVQKLFDTQQDWLFGYWSYELKNKTAQLHSANSDGIQSPDHCFYVPELVFIIKDNSLEVHYHKGQYRKDKLDEIIQKIENYSLPQAQKLLAPIQARISKEQYLNAIKKIQHHIQIGDVYELNFCQEFNTKAPNFNAASTYCKLNTISPTPYSCFGKWNTIEVMCASPERYLCKRGNEIISQPIKGTIKRGSTPDKDTQLKHQLYLSPKDRAENVMIVDLVRNDLSITAQKGSVRVKELFGIYSFPQVHQMISTICSKIHPKKKAMDVISHSFPMGSMTGAPKIRAMELIEKYEAFRRGIYSGSIGYIDPEGDMDFNVVIRSLIYNNENHYLSFAVGGAITIQSSPEGEYEETLLKAKALFELLKSSSSDHSL